MKFWARLTLAMVALALSTATAAGLLIYRNLQAAILPIASERLAAHTHSLSSDIATYVHDTRADVLARSNSAAVQGILRARAAGGIDPRDGSTEAAWSARLAENLAAELAAKPAYTQFRLIGVADGGRELVRVDRSGAGGEIRSFPRPSCSGKATATISSRPSGSP